MREGKLVYCIACTTDGFVAGEDGAYDFALTGGEYFADLIRDFPETFPAPAREALGVTADNQRFDAVLMGRHTYEIGTRVGLTSPYPQLQQYVFSRSMDASPDPAVTLVSGDALAQVRAMKQRAGRDIWLCGGGSLAGELFPEIDELILKIHPVIMGTGIPLFRGAPPLTRIDVIERKAYSNGVVRMHARMDHGPVQTTAPASTA